MVYVCHYDSPLGGITLSCNGEALTGLWFDGQKYFGDSLPDSYEEKYLPVFGQTVRWLDVYFGGKAPRFYAAALFGYHAFPQNRLGNNAYDSFRQNDDLRRNCP